MAARELESSYHLLEEAATPKRSGNHLAAVDPLSISASSWSSRITNSSPRSGLRPSRTSRCCWQAPAHPRSPNREIPLSQEAALRRHTTDLLGYALVIQAAAVNRRLKQDMVDQDPSLGQQNLKIMSFFDPDAPAYVLDIFEKYVNTKWPLRVYAIEPVIAQQNVADAFGRRTQSGLKIAAAAPLGPLRALSGLATAGLASERRSADDETAIRLNPTMVGFGAGESTFGWVFYPRLQTRTRDGKLVTDIALLINGRWPDPDRQGTEHRARPARVHCADRDAQLRPQDRVHHRGQLVPDQRGRRWPEVGAQEIVDPGPQGGRGRKRPRSGPRSKSTTVPKNTRSPWNG